MIIHAQGLTQRVIDGARRKYAEVDVTNDTITIRDQRLDFKEVVGFLQASGAVIQSAYLKEPSLDDVFLHITGKELRE